MKGLLLVEILRLSDTDGIPLDSSEPRPMFDPSLQPETSISLESVSYASSYNLDNSVQDTEPELDFELKRDAERPKKRRRLEESTRTCWTSRICSESPAEFVQIYNGDGTATRGVGDDGV
jgi:hypothetical protein